VRLALLSPIHPKNGSKTLQFESAASHVHLPRFLAGRCRENQRKSRAGDWRITSVVDDDQRTIIVLEVKHRKRAYPRQ
jgi:mRNA-degrading endonuclease RelE of RelBE toxin-antitoxin system